MFGFKRRRRKRLMARPFPAEWAAILERNVPYVRLLPDKDRNRLHGLIHVFLHEKEFEGCAGLKVTDEIRITIAGQASILLLGLEDEFYPTLRTILVYPDSYVAPLDERQEDGTVLEGEEARFGESWSHGSIVLSWDDVLKGASDIRDGYNLVIHEFAHQLDLESGSTEGAPRLPHHSMYSAWARVLSREYEQLAARAARRLPTLLDPYGATNPAEFFAVATEYFYEKPHALKRKHPELYEQLRLFFRRDPARFPKPGKPGTVTPF